MASGFVCEAVPRTLECVVCSGPFAWTPGRVGRAPMLCSDECRRKRKLRSNAVAACQTCQAPFAMRYGRQAAPNEHGRYCSVRCRPQSARVYASYKAMRRAQEHRRRAKKRQGPVERFDAHEIYERDAWMCGLCQQPVDPAVLFPDHMSASLDHIVPIARGGSHTRANVQCAHWICNSHKSDSLPSDR